jgi:hypothetical protein
MFFAMSCAQAQQDVGRVSRKHHRRDADVTVLCQYVLDCVGRDLRCVCLIIVSNRTPQSPMPVTVTVLGRPRAAA